MEDRITELNEILSNLRECVLRIDNYTARYETFELSENAQVLTDSLREEKAKLFNEIENGN